jgi:hypothetical protein
MCLKEQSKPAPKPLGSVETTNGTRTKHRCDIFLAGTVREQIERHRTLRGLTERLALAGFLISVARQDLHRWRVEGFGITDAATNRGLLTCLVTSASADSQSHVLRTAEVFEARL